MNIGDLLDNPLIQKYFGPGAYGDDITVGQPNEMAYRILSAMCEPIKKGDRCLLICQNLDIVEQSGNDTLRSEVFHWPYLRLPDQWQPVDVAGVQKCCDYGMGWRSELSPVQMCKKCLDNLKPEQSEAPERSDARRECECYKTPGGCGSENCRYRKSPSPDKGKNRLRGWCFHHKTDLEDCTCDCACKCCNSPDPVEEKIQELRKALDKTHILGEVGLALSHLRELVKLARKQK